MAIIVLTSVGASPGVTTTALGLALQWPRECLLVDADPHPCRTVESGYLGGQVAVGSGLSRMAAVQRSGADMASVLWQHVIALPKPDGGEGPRTNFLPGYSHLGQAQLMETMWPSIVDALRDLDQAEIDVIVDVGRTGTARPPQSLMAAASVVAVVTRSQLRSLVPLALHGELIGEINAEGTARRGLLVIGPGQPYGPREITKQFHLPVLATLADDPRTAACLLDAPSPRRWRRSSLAMSLSRVAHILAEQARQHRATAGPAPHSVAIQQPSMVHRHGELEVC